MHFSVGMIPNNPWEITINDIDEYRRNSYNREKNKIQSHLIHLLSMKMGMELQSILSNIIFEEFLIC